MNWLEAMQARHSTRRYSEQPVAAELLERLLATSRQVVWLIEPKVRLALVSGRERVGRILSSPGSVYSLVQGAPHLLVGLLPQERDWGRLELGYNLEHVVLEATRLGIATCWMTGSYHPEAAAEEVARPGEVVAAAVALGYPRRDMLARTYERAVRSVVAAHRRLPLEELVFAGRWGVSWQREEADPALVTILEHARLAPSARNGQPWRFILTGEKLVLALVRPAPIDAGIVMAHVALAAREVGWPGRWTVRWDNPLYIRPLDLPWGAMVAATFSADQ